MKLCKLGAGNETVQGWGLGMRLCMYVYACVRVPHNSVCVHSCHSGSIGRELAVCNGCSVIRICLLADW